MARCVNCSLSLVHPLPYRQIGEATDVMLSILRSWICPVIVSADDYLCLECFIILQRESINDSSGSAIVRTYGHQHVCFVCGTSTLRAKTHRVPLNSPEGNIIMSCIPTQQVHRLERVCLACWTNAYRNVKRYTQQDQNRVKVESSESIELSMTSPRSLLSGASETSTSLMELPIPTPPQLPASQLYVMQNVESAPKITSHIYKRAAASSRHCIFVECQNAERLLVPSVIKEMLLLEHKLYVPVSARICKHHLNDGAWDELVLNYNDFTGRQMDDMLSMLDRASRRQLDFSNIREMNPHLCRYWLGMNSEQFHQLLLNTPRLTKEVPCPSVALSIMLVKLRTGDTNERLTTLFRLPRSTLERYMTKARNCLGNSFVPLFKIR